MAIITLISDWGLKDHYLGAVKGTILSQIPETTIVDITHLIPSFDIQQASFILKNCYFNFPKGTVHIIGVNTEASIKSPHTAIEYDGHYFIGADNGVFALIFDNEPEKIIELNLIQDSDYFTFSTRDVFVKAAVHLANGNKIEELGLERKALNDRMHIKAVVEKSMIRGSVIYVDAYENVITNIRESLFKEIGKSRRFNIYFRTPGYEINQLSLSYNDVVLGEKLALFGSTGFLEIAINQGKASSLLGLKMNDVVRIEFDD
ncbi:MAG: SAM-dependent chlorinase/fluorinase [Bacteroidetes bacterium]|nr:SAM-dependent chlorinase/fluorinase [Bacteroidota bacterium]